MPFEFSDQTLPSGTPYLRLDASGQVELADGEAFAAQLERPEYRNGKVLSVVLAGTVYSREARKYFPNLDKKYSSLAAVVTSPIVRATINLMVRLTPQGSRMRMFKDEASALEWLEQRPLPKPSPGSEPE